MTRMRRSGVFNDDEDDYELDPKTGKRVFKKKKN